MRHFGLLLFIFLLSVSSYAFSDEKIEFNDSLPIASIDASRENGSWVLKSSSSKDNLNKGLAVSWTAYLMKFNEEKGIEQIYVGASPSDADASEDIKLLPKGLYNIVLTVTNQDGISSSSSEVIAVTPRNSPRFYAKVGKGAIKKIIKGINKGWFDWLIPNKYQRPLKTQLNSLLRLETIYTNQAVGYITTGLMNGGMSYKMANSIAHKIVYVLL